MDYQVISYTPDQDGDIAQLQEHLWAGNPARNAAYLKWKYIASMTPAGAAIGSPSTSAPDR